MTEDDEGGVDVCDQGQGGDEVPEVSYPVMDLHHYHNTIIGYGAIETVMDGLKS